MPYQRVWVPELNAYKIIGELTYEEAKALEATVPEGSTQWGWGAKSGTFAYGNVEDSRKEAYITPPLEIANMLFDTPFMKLDIETGAITPRDYSAFGGGESGGGGASASWDVPDQKPPGVEPGTIFASMGIVGALLIAVFAFGKK